VEKPKAPSTNDAPMGCQAICQSKVIINWHQWPRTNWMMKQRFLPTIATIAEMQSENGPRRID